LPWIKLQDLPGVQTWQFSTKADASPDDEQLRVNTAVGDAELRHANQQIALASQYPGRERSMPRAKIIEFDTAKR
jgi:hypothetical protein